MNPKTTRRDFLKTSTAFGIGAPLVFAAPAHGFKANQRINLGFIGLGRQSMGHLGRFLRERDVQVVAVCDVESTRREHNRQRVDDAYAEQRKKGTYKGCVSYVDFRELLARDDIDAVVIGTPDHWHAIPAIGAARAGKDIYCEKPLSLTIAEGRAMVTAARKHKVVFQTGSQQRSEFAGRFRKAVELVRNGHIGEVKTIRIGVGGPAVPCDLPTEDVPDGTDWNLWLGPSPKRGYNEILCPKGIHKHFPQWRRYREFAGGGLADMGAHHFDIAQWALGMDDSGPVKIEPPEGTAHSGLKYTYANGVEMFHGGPNGCTFEGTKGTIYVDRPKIVSKPEDIVQHETGPDEFHVYASTDHRRNWLDCIRSRELPICDVEIGHRSSTVCELGNIGYELRRPLRWDPKNERFVDDDEANSKISRQLREPWTL